MKTEIIGRNKIGNNDYSATLVYYFRGGALYENVKIYGSGKVVKTVYRVNNLELLHQRFDSVTIIKIMKGWQLWKIIW